MYTGVPNNYDNLLFEYNKLKEILAYRQAVGNEFIERMHYDFNTLLNSITGYLYAIYENSDQSQKPAIDNALKTSTALLGKFSDMTDYLSLIMGGYVSEKVPSSLRMMLRQINQKQDAALAAKNLNLKCEIDDDIPEYVETDYVVVKKAVSMLIENALQNTPYGTITAAVSLVSKENDVIKLKFSVSDEGGGIDADRLNNIFSGCAAEEGDFSKSRLLGSGLQIAKDFLELLGASLTAENNADKGSTFSFTLDTLDIEAGDAENAAAAKLDADAPGKALPGINVLLADDSVIIQQIVKQMLESEGAAVTVALNGELAVQEFTKARFDVVLMDIEMPMLNGYEAARKITSIKNEQGLTTPVIGMTAHTGQEEFDKCIESGMSAAVIKPFKLKDIVGAIYKDLYDKEFVDTGEVVAAEESSIYNFEKIKGIDYKEGVKRLAGNEKVYFELLQNFRDGYSDVAANISALLKEGQDNEVKSVLHLVKGITGNLSFNEVYDYANKLREAVKNDDITEITKYLKLFKDALEEFKVSFEEAEVEIMYSMSEMLDMDLLLVKTRLSDLLEYLSNDVDLGNAVDACNDIYDYMKEPDDKRDFERIKDAVGSFDLELAETLLKTFISKFS